METVAGACREGDKREQREEEEKRDDVKEPRP